MTQYDLTDYRHYMHLPVCGFCMNAWDIIYRRVRHGTSPERWLEYCPVGGCDPDVWNYLGDHGWPKGYKLDAHGRPQWVKVRKLAIPEYDNRVFHKRSNDAPGAPWRKVSPKLADAWSAQRGKGKPKLNTPVEDIEWDDEEEPLVAAVIADVDDDDIW